MATCLEHRSTNDFYAILDSIEVLVQFNVPINIEAMTEVEKKEIHDSVQVLEGCVYFHRIPNPTEASVHYSSTYILSKLRETRCTRLILDFTERELVGHKLRRLMLRHVPDTDLNVTDVAIVLDGNSFRRVIIDFFVRAYLHSRDINVRFFATKSQAIAYMQLANQR